MEDKRSALQVDKVTLFKLRVDNVNSGQIICEFIRITPINNII